jgi:hypothetical protein
MIIYGSRPIRIRMRQNPDMPVCTCSNCFQSVQFNPTQVLSFFTLFFIPIIPWRLQYFFVCPACDMAFKVTRKEARESFSTGVTVSKAGMAENMYNTPEQTATAPFIMPTAQILQMEKKTRLRGNLLFFVLGVLMLTLWWGNGTTNLTDIFLLAFGGLSTLGVIVWAPFEVINFARKKSRLPDKIFFENGNLHIGQHTIDIYRDIQDIGVTSIRVRSSSLFPAQRFLSVRTGTGRLWFWLGTGASMHDSKYLQLCDMLALGLNQNGAFLKYTKGKFDWVNNL